MIFERTMTYSICFRMVRPSSTICRAHSQCMDFESRVQSFQKSVSKESTPKQYRNSRMKVGPRPSETGLGLRCCGFSFLGVHRYVYIYIYYNTSRAILGVELTQVEAFGAC